MSSLLESANPTSEPSKYNDQVPLVSAPNVVGVNSKISSSRPLTTMPPTPGTEALPVVEISTWPLGSRLTESMFSPFVSSPTSAPFKYILNVPAVFAPSEVASNCTTSRGAIARPLRVMALLNDIRIVSASTMENANKSRLETPTSTPSKNRLQVTPSNCTISSSEKETPPTLPLLVNEAKRGLLDGSAVGVIVGVFVGDGPGVKVEVAVNVAVGVNVLVGVKVLVGVDVGPGVKVFVGVLVVVGVRLGVGVLRPATLNS